MWEHLVWANPMWAWATPLAVGLPVLAHLWGGRATRRAVFPTLRFLRAAQQAAQRRRQLRSWLVLFLRCLVLLLVVGAFAQPVWHTVAAGATKRGQMAVLILDRSASMTRREQGRSLFELAREQVIQTINNLDPNRDRGAVILLDGAPRLLLPEPTADLAYLAAQVRLVEPTQQTGNLAGALRLAESLPRSAGGQSAGFIPGMDLFSDMQASQEYDAGASGGAVHRHRLGQTQRNLAITNPILQPVQPVVRQTALVQAEVAFFSPNAAETRNVPVTLEFQGRKQTTAARVASGGSATVRFTIVPDQPGPAHLSLRTEDSAGNFSLDKQTGLFFGVSPGRRVALVTASDPHNPATAAYYLLRALAPAAGPGREIDPHTGVTLSLHQPADGVKIFSPLPAAAVVVLVATGTVDPPFLAGLRAHLDRGGGALWIVDSPAAAASLAQWETPMTHACLSPIIPGAWRENISPSLVWGQFHDPILAVFEGPAAVRLLRTRFTNIMEGRLAPSATALLTWDQDHPCLAVRWIGAGRLAVLAADLAPQAGDLVKQPVFVPLLHQLIQHLAPGPPAISNLHPGMSGRVSLAAQTLSPHLTARDPHGRSTPAQFAQEGDTLVATLPSLSQCGPYTIWDGPHLSGGVQVELDPAESDWRVWEQPRSVPGHANDLTRQETSTMPAATGSENPLWPWLLAAALGLLVLEPLLLLADARYQLFRQQRKAGETKSRV